MTGTNLLNILFIFVEFVQCSEDELIVRVGNVQPLRGVIGVDGQRAQWIVRRRIVR